MRKQRCRLISAFVFATYKPLQPSSVIAKPGLYLTWYETWKTGFLVRPTFLYKLIYEIFFQNFGARGGNKNKIKIPKMDQSIEK